MKKSSVAYYPLTVIFLTIIVGLSGCLQPDTSSKEFSLMIVDLTGSSTNITLSTLKSLDIISGTSSYENSFNNTRGYGVYTGVAISSILESIGITLLPDEFLIVTATDGYSGVFQYENIYPNASWQNVQGSLILAYAFNETELPEWDLGPRIAFLPLDELYSNADKGNTSSLNIAGSAGSRWISNVVSFEVKR